MYYTYNEKNYIAFLSSDLFKGIGEKTASAIFSLWGETTLNVIENSEVDSLKVEEKLKKKLQIIKDFTYTPDYKLLSLLMVNGLTLNKASKVLNLIKEEEIDAEDFLKKPDLIYNKLTEIDGIGFIIADKFALGLKIVNNFVRVKYAISFLFKKYNSEGHHGIKKPKLIADLIELFDDSPEIIGKAEILEHLKQLKAEEFIIDSDYDSSIVKHNYDYNLEIDLAELIVEKIERSANKKIEEILPLFIESEETVTDIVLTPQQRKALFMAINNKLSILIGSAGTGKSYVTSLLVKFLVSCSYRCLCLAPTGKASQRTKQLLKAQGLQDTVQSMTIHKFFMMWGEQNFDFILVDETSMITSKMLYDLMSALPKQAQILMIGDAHQLPAIGAGNILADLLKIESIPHIELSVPQRTVGAKILPQFYDAVRRGELRVDLIEKCLPSEIPSKFESGAEILLIEAKPPEILSKLKESLVHFSCISDLISNAIIISPSNKNENGVTNINSNVQTIFNPRGIGLYRQFKTYDRVMQTVNEYSEGQMISANGEVGTATRLADVATIEIKWESGVTALYCSKIYDITLNYAITVHKSQGSEYQDVIIVLDRTQVYQHCRQLIYTALTRSRRRIILVGELDVLNYAIRNNTPSVRNTDLANYLLN